MTTNTTNFLHIANTVAEPILGAFVGLTGLFQLVSTVKEIKSLRASLSPESEIDQKWCSQEVEPNYYAEQYEAHFGIKEEIESNIFNQHTFTENATDANHKKMKLRVETQIQLNLTYAKLVLLLGSTGVGATLLVSTTADFSGAALTLVGAAFFPIAIMSALLVKECINLIKIELYIATLGQENSDFLKYAIGNRNRILIEVGAKAIMLAGCVVALVAASTASFGLPLLLMLIGGALSLLIMAIEKHKQHQITKKNLAFFKPSPRSPSSPSQIFTPDGSFSREQESEFNTRLSSSRCQKFRTLIREKFDRSDNRLTHSLSDSLTRSMSGA